MANIKDKSQKFATKHRNEDFSFYRELEVGSLLVVGDFASSDFSTIDRVGNEELENALRQFSLPPNNPALALTHLATHFNSRLLVYHENWKESFQCCAVFALLAGDKLFYLPIGDCRAVVVQGGSLMLLNGSVWRDASLNELPPVINRGQEVRRGSDEPPSVALGITQFEQLQAGVKQFQLGRNDVVILCSDGVDKKVSPVRLLELASKARTPEKLIEDVLNEVEERQGDDDRTLLVAFGPHLPRSETHGQKKLDEMQSAVNQNIEWVKKESNKLPQLVNEYTQALQKQAGQEKFNLTEYAKREREGFENMLNKMKDQVERIHREAEQDVSLQLQDWRQTFVNQVGQQLGEAIQTSISQLPQPLELEQITTALDAALKVWSGSQTKVIDQEQITDAVDAALKSLMDKMRSRPSTDNETSGNLIEINSSLRSLNASVTSLHALLDNSSLRSANTVETANLHGKDNAQPGTEPEQNVAPNYVQEGDQHPSPSSHQSPDAATTAHPGPQLQAFSSATQFHEGIIRITLTNLDLLNDENLSVVENNSIGGDPRARYLFPTPNAPAGWLTAWYLHFLHRRNEQQQYKSLIEKTDLMIQHTPDYLHRIQKNELVKWREKHWELRSKYSSMRATKSNSEFLKQELALAKEFHQEVIRRASLQTDQPPIKDDTSAGWLKRLPGWIKSRWNKSRWNKVGIIIIAVALVAVFTALIYWLISYFGSAPNSGGAE